MIPEALPGGVRATVRKDSPPPGMDHTRTGSMFWIIAYTLASLFVAYQFASYHKQQRAAQLAADRYKENAP